jgi:nitrite reductase/ring-hydroxylating ferredoxin subunit
VGGALNTIGILSAIPTALSGLADYSSIKQNAVKEGMLHAGTNSAAFVLHLLGWQARWRQKWFQGLIWSNLGTAVASVGAWLGGDLVYRLRVGVNYSDESANLDDWTAVATEKEIIDGTPLRVEIDDIPIMLIRDKDALHAMNATCAHAGGPLDEGTVDGHRVTCPWHDSVFNLCDGSVIHGPAVYPQPTYDVRIRNGHVEIRRPQLAHESDKA